MSERRRRRPIALWFGAIVLGIFALAAVWPQSWLPHDPRRSTGRPLLPPRWFADGNAEHLLGTDSLGKDIFSMLVAGTRFTMIVVLAAALIGLVVGVSAGLAAGYYGGWVDSLIMRITDVQLAFPVIILLIAVTSALGASMLNLILVLGLAAWAPYARMVRGSVLTVRDADYIRAAIAIGLPSRRIVRRHVLPNVLTPIIIYLTFELAGLVLLESALSFLGFGASPSTPSWGKMVAEARGNMHDAWWASAMPGALIVLAVLAFSLLGDEMRDRLDPRLEFS